MQAVQRVADKLAQNFGGPADQLGSSTFELEQTPDLSNKVALVTGGSEVCCLTPHPIGHH